MNYNVALPFYENSERYPENTVVGVADRTVSYSELRKLVQAIARWLQQKSAGNVTRFGILASRSIETFAGILARCWAGGTYLPLNHRDFISLLGGKTA